MGDLSNELQSHSIDSGNYPSQKSEVVHERKSIQQIWDHPIQHISWWPHCLGVRLQMSDVPHQNHLSFPQMIFTGFSK